MRRKLALLSIVAGLLTLTGCWDYTELNQEELVVGVSLDVGQSKAYLLAVEVVCFDGEEASGRVHMAEGDNLDECVHGLVRQLGQFPLFPHSTVLLFSEEIARQNLMPVLDWIVKDRKIPLGILLTMVERGPAYELMQAGIGKLPRSLTIAEMLHDELTYGKIHAIPLYVFYDEAMTLGKTSSIPSIMLRSNPELVNPQQQEEGRSIKGGGGGGGGGNQSEEQGDGRFAYFIGIRMFKNGTLLTKDEIW